MKQLLRVRIVDKKGKGFNTTGEVGMFLVLTHRVDRCFLVVSHLVFHVLVLKHFESFHHTKNVKVTIVLPYFTQLFGYVFIISSYKYRL